MLLKQKRNTSRIQSVTNNPNTMQNPQTSQLPPIKIAIAKKTKKQPHYKTYKSSRLHIWPLRRINSIKLSASSPHTSRTPGRRSRHEESIFHLQIRLRIPIDSHN
jgi:hypothetical protein